MTQEQKMREAFEEWCAKNINGAYFTKHDGEYRHIFVDCAYNAWQAATAHAKQEMVERLEKPEVLGMVGAAITKQCDFTYNMSKSAALAALTEIKKLLMKG